MSTPGKLQVRDSSLDQTANRTSKQSTSSSLTVDLRLLDSLCFECELGSMRRLAKSRKGLTSCAKSFGSKLQTSTMTILLLLLVVVEAFSFHPIMSSSQQYQHPFCELPGDPSLILTTNVDLGAKKMEIMKAMSKAICEHTGKPESYIAVCINDKADVIFGGSDAPTALGCLYSIGAIAKESNGAITASVSDLLKDFGVADDRIYINFFDVPRANVGWSRKTFAG